MTESSAVLFGEIRFTGNKADEGGALLSWNSTVNTGLNKTLHHNSVQFGSEGFAAAHNALENKTNTGIVFENNTADSRGGGWATFWSRITITGTVNFTSNRAYRGGGLFCSNSVVEFKSPLTLMFYSNIAKDVGGTIFYEVPNVDSIKATGTNNCFFIVAVDNVSFSHINIDFVDSHAEEGMDIFGNDLDRCIVYINNTKSNITGYQFFHIVSSHYHHTNISLSITSFPRYLCFCDNGAYDCSIKSKELIVPPGKTFNISVIGVGLFNEPVPSRTETYFQSYHDTELRRKLQN